MKVKLSAKQMCLEEKDLVQSGVTRVRLSDCLYCNSHYYIIEEFKSKIVTCPKCEEQCKVRCFKNGNLRISTISK